MRQDWLDDDSFACIFSVDWSREQINKDLRCSINWKKRTWICSCDGTNVDNDTSSLRFHLRKYNLDHFSCRYEINVDYVVDKCWSVCHLELRVILRSTIRNSDTVYKYMDVWKQINLLLNILVNSRRFTKVDHECPDLFALWIPISNWRLDFRQFSFISSDQEEVESFGCKGSRILKSNSISRSCDHSPRVGIDLPLIVLSKSISQPTCPDSFEHLGCQPKEEYPECSETDSRIETHVFLNETVLVEGVIWGNKLRKGYISSVTWSYCSAISGFVDVLMEEKLSRNCELHKSRWRRQQQSCCEMRVTCFSSALLLQAKEGRRTPVILWSFCDHDGRDKCFRSQRDIDNLFFRLLRGTTFNQRQQFNWQIILYLRLQSAHFCHT